jgi:hypothetical protein
MPSRRRGEPGNGPASADLSGVNAVSSAGLSIDGTMPKMYTGTSIPLATAAASPGWSLLAVSAPSVSTTTARRRPSRSPTRFAVRAIASCSEVAPNGTTLDMMFGSVFNPIVKSVR